MPTYEYQCAACGVVEAVQSMRDAALTKCPQCKRRKVTRIISGGGGVIFRGDGFWETDYNRSKDYSAKKKGEKTEATVPAATTAPAATETSKPATPVPAPPAPKAPATVKPPSPRRDDRTTRRLNDRTTN